MWNRKKEEEPPARPAQAPVAPVQSQVPKEAPAMSSMPMRSYDPPVVPNTATIGKAVIVKGQIFSREDLVIDGEVEGTVEAQDHRVTVGPNGKVQAGIKAREIVVLGVIHGNVEVADKIEIRKDARLVGDIKTSRIGIEDGAYFKGSIDIQRTEPKPQRQSQAPLQSPPASAPAPPPAAAAGASDPRK